MGNKSVGCIEGGWAWADGGDEARPYSVGGWTDGPQDQRGKLANTLGRLLGAGVTVSCPDCDADLKVEVGFDGDLKITHVHHHT